MICPFCSKEMKAGTIYFDGRTRIQWFENEGENPQSVKFWNYLSGIGDLTAAEYDIFSRGKIKSEYCPSCKKMIFETDIMK